MDKEAAAPRRCIYETPWPSYSLAWSARSDPRFRLAVGSCIEQETNHLQVIDWNAESNSFEVSAETEHPLPPTKLMWNPDENAVSWQGRPDLLASVSTSLNLWKVKDGQLELLARMANTRKPQGQGAQLPPLTSFDWTAAGHHRIGTASIDTTCTIWNLETQKIETQLIAHDKAVYDITFSEEFLFASVGADGSLRLFDQRNLEHSTIIYETSPPSPLLRLAWSRHNKHHIAAIAMDTLGVTLIDVRRPSMTLVAFAHHEACVNTIAWAPHARNQLLCGTQDGGVLVWDVMKEAPSTPEGPRPQPLLAHSCSQEVSQVLWPASQPDKVAVGMVRQVEVLQM
eukprot:CAMPEP_0197911434 /NCGR_PEP_ID=MMETSP1439-20131203/72797_1 /TAXON_ID=66791 /ORGANISM="Gonyaulax spinifera, Strain CCMP409" /LENGTH=340 /DNA_ID=CAMNT_0043533163 /DNA_START=58 /DNA_END=1080 /DNA_ORIENTATION=+